MTLSAPSLCLSIGRSVCYISVTYRSKGKERGVIKFYGVNEKKKVEAERFPLYVSGGGTKQKL